MDHKENITKIIAESSLWNFGGIELEIKKLAKLIAKRIGEEWRYSCKEVINK